MRLMSQNLILTRVSIVGDIRTVQNVIVAQELKLWIEAAHRCIVGEVNWTLSLSLIALAAPVLVYCKQNYIQIKGPFGKEMKAKRFFIGGGGDNLVNNYF